MDKEKDVTITQLEGTMFGEIFHAVAMKSANTTCLTFQYLIFARIKLNNVSVIKTAVFAKYEPVLGMFFLLLFIKSN